MDSCASFLCLLRNFLKKCLMKTCLAAAAAVLIATTVAGSAADLAVKAVPYVAPPPSSINWTGFYIGINSGYAFGASDVQYSSAPTFFNPAQFNAPIFAANYAALSTGSLSANRDGFIGGGQIGYNWQFSRLVTGIEADIQALTGAANQATVGSRVDQFTNTYNSVIAASSKL